MAGTLKVESNVIITVREVITLCPRGGHSSPESGPNPKVNNHPESIWNMVWLFMPVEKNLFRKFFIGGPSRKF